MFLYTYKPLPTSIKALTNKSGPSSPTKKPAQYKWKHILHFHMSVRHLIFRKKLQMQATAWGTPQFSLSELVRPRKQHHGCPSSAPRKDRLLTRPGETLPRPEPWPRSPQQLLGEGNKTDSLTSAPTWPPSSWGSARPPQHQPHSSTFTCRGRRRPQHHPCPGAHSQTTSSCTAPRGFISSYFAALPPSGSPHALAAVYFILKIPIG